MQYEPLQILDHFDDIIKSAIKTSFIDWRNGHQDKVGKLQSTLDILKIHLVHSEEWKNLPEDFWAEIEVKVSKILNWTDSLLYTPENINLKKISEKWHNQFNDLMSEFPEEMWILIGDTFWQSQTGDSIFTRIRKRYQPLNRWFKGIQRFIVNLSRRIRKKPILEKNKTARKINLHNFLYNYIESPLMKFTIFEWQRYLQAVAGQLFVLHNKTKELTTKSLLLEEFESFFDFSEKKDIFSKLFELAEILKKMDETLQALSQYEKQFQDRLDKAWDELKENFLKMWSLAGTFQLPAKKYSDQRFKYNMMKFESKFDKNYKSWQIHFRGLKDGWQKDLQLCILQLRAARIARSIIVDLREKVENIIKPAFFEMFSLLDKRIKNFDSITSIKDLEQAIITEKNTFLKKLQKVQLPQLIDTIYQVQFDRTLNNFMLEVMAIFENISNEYCLYQNRDTKNLPPRSKVTDVALKDLIHKNVLLDLQENHKQSVKLTEVRLEKIFRTISEIEQVVDFNMNEALILIKDEDDESNLKEAKNVIISGLQRGVDLTDKLVKECSSIPEDLTKQLLDNTLSFENKINLLTDNDKIFELKSRSDREELRNNRKQSRRKMFNYFKSFIPIIFSTITNLFKKMKASDYLEVDQKEIFGHSNMNEIENELHQYHINITGQLSRLPYVYQRLFQFEPISDERFFTSRESELKLLQEDFQNWQKGENVLTALIGEQGSGKTTLLNFSEKQIFPPYPISRLKLDQRVISEPDLINMLSKSLGLSEIANFSDIEKKLLQSEVPQAFIVENIQYLFLRIVQGFDLLENFLQLVLKTQDKVFWIITCNLFTWQYLERATQISKNFQRIINLDIFSKEQIKSIILKRHNISGYNIEFEINRDVKKSSEYKKLQDKQKKQEYIMDFFFNELNIIAHGNVTLSMFYWLRAIKQILKDKIIISSSISSDNSILDNLYSNDLFTLGCVLQHGKLSIDDHALILRQNVVESQSTLSRLYNFGLLDREEENYQIHTYLYRPISQVLKSKNILP